MNSGTDRYGIAIWDRLAFAEQHWDVTGETDLPAILSGRPCSPISLGGLADANFFGGHIERAREGYTLLLERHPDKPALMQRLLHCHDVVCDWAARSPLAVALDDMTNRVGVIEGYEPLCYLSLPMDISRSRLFAERRAAPVQKWVGDKKLTRQNTTKQLRIGYISIDFRSHSCGTPLWPVLKVHNRDRFYVIAYSLAAGDFRDTIIPRVAGCTDAVRDLAGDTWNQALRRIRADNLDILVDTTRNIRGAPLSLLARQLAPIEVSAWGFGGAPGNSMIDVVLGDETCFPMHEDGYYSEQIRRLPAYHPPSECEYVDLPALHGRTAVGLPVDSVVLACFVAHYKINEDIFGCWMRILQRVPSAILWLMEGTETGRRNLQHAAAKLGVDPMRLFFAPPVARQHHLARMRLVDLVLDNPRLGGSASIPDALSTATPGITWHGVVPEERGGASYLRASGFPDLVACGVNAYEDLAVQLASDCSARINIRSRMLLRIEETCDGLRSWVRGFEAILEDIAEPEHKS